MKSVCHLTSVHPTFDIRIFHKECISLAKTGYVVTLIAPKSDGEIVNGVRIIHIELPTSRLKRMFSVTLKMFRLAMKQKAQLYHFHDPELMFCGVLLRLSGKKVVFDIHENVALSLLSKDWLAKPLRQLAKYLYRFIEKSSLLFFNALVLAEESYLQYYPVKKSTVVLNYPINKKVNQRDNDFKTPLQFIYIGGISETRGLWEMIELVELLNAEGLQVELTLVGKIWSADLQIRLKKKLSSQNLLRFVKWVGVVPFQEVQGYLKKADIGLALLHPIPNYKESLPTKIFEYMQHGIPVITSDFPLYERYMKESKAGIVVDPISIKDMVEKITSMLNDQEQLKVMAKNGQNAVQTMYKWKLEEQKLLSLYDKLLA